MYIAVTVPQGRAVIETVAVVAVEAARTLAVRSVVRGPQLHRTPEVIVCTSQVWGTEGRARDVIARLSRGFMQLVGLEWLEGFERIAMLESNGRSAVVRIGVGDSSCQNLKRHHKASNLKS